MEPERPSQVKGIEPQYETLLAAAPAFDSAARTRAKAFEIKADCSGAPDEIEVAILIPLSGLAAILGQDMLDSARLALKDVGSNDLCLLPLDTGATAAESREAAERAIKADVSLILGPLFSSAVSEVGPLARQRNIRVVAFSNNASVASEGTFLLGFRLEEQIDRIVRFALSKSLKRIAALAPDDLYGETAMDAFKRAVTEGGGDLGPTVFYPSDGDPSAIVREIADHDDSPFHAVLIADGGARLHKVAKLLAFHGVDPDDVRFLGTMRWRDDPKTLQEPALQGGWFPSSPPEYLAAFQGRFERMFGRAPLPIAVIAYDAAALAVVVQRDLGDRTFGPSELTNPEGFSGASGLFRLRRDGLTERSLAVVEIKDGSTRTVDPAEGRFSSQ